MEEKTIKSISPASLAMMKGIISAVIALIVGLIYAAVFAAIRSSISNQVTAAFQTTDLIIASLGYTDLSVDNTTLTCSTAKTWRRKTLTKTAGKRIQLIGLSETAPLNCGACWIDDFVGVI